MILTAGAAAAGAAATARCGGTTAAPGGVPPGADITGPKEIAWSLTDLGDAWRQAWNDTYRLAEQATGIKITASWEPGSGYWDKRQAEVAAGAPSVDLMYNQTNWVLPGGLKGMFVDHYEYLRRDKVDTKQYFQAALDTWAWKGKLWSIPYQAGGEVVHLNKPVFDAKGIKYPTKDWTYESFLDICRRLTDPPNRKFAIDVGQNGIHYVMGTFILNHGGKRLNDAKDRALYGDDANSLRGAELDVDLHTKYQVTPAADVVKSLAPGKRPIEVQMTAMEINGMFRHSAIRAVIGDDNYDVVPPPKGPSGVQTASVGGNGLSILALSKARDAAWHALRWLHGKEGMVSPHIKVISGPPLIPAASAPQWLDMFKGTHLADCQQVFAKAGHDLLVLPEGNQAWDVMNAPLNRALGGEIAAREAMQESARQLNELFAQRPAAWR
jgi:multiple sugar transport system substrate-binding protein